MGKITVIKFGVNNYAGNIFSAVELRAQTTKQQRTKIKKNVKTRFPKNNKTQMRLTAAARLRALLPLLPCIAPQRRNRWSPQEAVAEKPEEAEEPLPSIR